MNLVRRSDDGQKSAATVQTLIYGTTFVEKTANNGRNIHKNGSILLLWKPLIGLDGIRLLDPSRFKCFQAAEFDEKHRN